MHPANFAFQKLKQFQFLFLFTSLYSVSLKSQTFMDFCFAVNSQFFLVTGIRKKIDRENHRSEILYVLQFFFSTELMKRILPSPLLKK